MSRRSRLSRLAGLPQSTAGELQRRWSGSRRGTSVTDAQQRRRLRMKCCRTARQMSAAERCWPACAGTCACVHLAQVRAGGWLLV
eukprot:353794-Chlamydomonas_euryale.AAC.6